MKVYRVLTEGKDEGGRFFAMFLIAKVDEQSAVQATQVLAHRRGFQLEAVDEIVEVEFDSKARCRDGVVHEYGRTYFDS